MGLENDLNNKHLNNKVKIKVVRSILKGYFILTTIAILTLFFLEFNFDENIFNLFFLIWMGIFVSIYCLYIYYSHRDSVFEDNKLQK